MELGAWIPATAPPLPAKLSRLLLYLPGKAAGSNARELTPAAPTSLASQKCGYTAAILGTTAVGSLNLWASDHRDTTLRQLPATTRASVVATCAGIWVSSILGRCDIRLQLTGAGLVPARRIDS